jgi:hypothetical protein
VGSQLAASMKVDVHEVEHNKKEHTINSSILYCNQNKIVATLPRGSLTYYAEIVNEMKQNNDAGSARCIQRD